LEKGKRVSKRKEKRERKKMDKENNSIQRETKGDIHNNQGFDFKSMNVVKYDLYRT